MNNKLSDNKIVTKIRNYQVLIALKIMLPILAIIIPFILLIFNPVIEFITDYNSFLIISAIIFVATIIFSCVGKNWDKKLKSFVGENVTREILAEKIDIKKYNPSSFIDRDYIKNSNIVPRYDKIYGSDYVKGMYKGVEIIYCDLELGKRKKSRSERNNPRSKNSYINTVFKGPFISLKMKNKIEGYLKISERKTPRKEKGFLDEVFDSVVEGAASAIGTNIKNNILEVENDAFNNQFQIKTNNEELAFYILTPHFMESIVKLDNMAQGYTNIRFKGKDVDISINNGEDSFSVAKTMFSTKRLEKTREKMRKDLDLILDIVDEILDKDQLF